MTGEELWSGTDDMIGTIEDFPVVLGDTIYLPHFSAKAGTASASWLLALDAQTGKIRWRMQDTEQTGTAIVGGDGDLALAAHSSNDGSELIGLDAATGKARWTATFPRLVQRAYLAPAARTIYTVEGNAVESDDVVALDATTGQETWRVTVPGEGGAQIVAALDSEVLFTAGGQVSLLAAADGSTTWTVADPASTGPGLNTSFKVTSDALLMMTTGKGTAHVAAVDLADGTRRWADDLDATITHSAAPVVAGNQLVLGTSTSQTSGLTDGLLALDLASGQQAWTVALPAIDTFLADAGTIYLTGGGAVHALAADTGKETWQLAFTDLPDLRLMTVSNGVLYLNSTDSAGATLVAVESNAPKAGG